MLASVEIGPRLEIGSGIGAIKEQIPDCVTSDLFANPWIDRVENAYAIGYPDRSLGTLILFDVWHHLQYPGTALVEFRRVLRPGGRLILFEPAASLLGRMVYGLFHHEPLGMTRPITWSAPADFEPAAQTYYAAQGNCWRMFADGELPPEASGWELRSAEPFCDLTYLASGGFSRPQIYPTGLYPFLKKLDHLAGRYPRIFATRMLVVLERK